MELLPLSTIILNKRNKSNYFKIIQLKIILKIKLKDNLLVCQKTTCNL